MSSSSSSSSLRRLLPLLGVGVVGAAAASFAGCRLIRQRRRANPRLDYTLQQQIDELKAVYPALRDEFIQDVKEKYQFPQYALDRLKKMFDYTILGGKYYRATLVLNTVQSLAKESGADIDKVWDQALVLGWCIEILQALFLVADDIMDGSQLRRGQPCWYKQPDVQNDAINDTLILESFLFFLINRHFASHRKLIAITQLFQSVSYQTQMGQMLDLLSQPQGIKDPKLLKEFNIDVYNRIVTFKTAIYTFYLPIACGLYLLNYDSPKQLDLARTISIELGKKFQIEDDYLDCFGDPAKIGKDGTDIKDHKCSWLVVQALGRVNARQRDILDQNYGKDDKKNEQAVKQLYKELDLQSVYDKQEDESYAKVEQLITQNEKMLPRDVFMPILKKIHRREK